MSNLITINGVPLPEPSSYSISTNNKINEFEAESGKKTLDVVRQNIYSISISYSGILENKLKSLQQLLSSVVVNVGFYDTQSGSNITKRMKVSGKSQGKNYFKDGISAWSYSFSLEEL